MSQTMRYAGTMQDLSRHIVTSVVTVTACPHEGLRKVEKKLQVDVRVAIELSQETFSMRSSLL